jgi:hypothetical protein
MSRKEGISLFSNPRPRPASLLLALVGGVLSTPSVTSRLVEVRRCQDEVLLVIDEDPAKVSPDLLAAVQAQIGAQIHDKIEQDLVDALRNPDKHW